MSFRYRRRLAEGSPYENVDETVRVVELTDGNLGRHLGVLATAGYVSTRRGYDGRRSRTWVRITPQGSTAVQLEIDALRAIIDRADATS